MKILVLNSGSSSLKYQLFEMPNGLVLCAGMVEKIGEENGFLTHKVTKAGKTTKYEMNFAIPDHKVALQHVAEILTDPDKGVVGTSDEIGAVGHRVVHGGESFSATIEVDEAVKAKIKALYSLAPLHNPPNLQGIEVAEKVFNKAKQLAVFDTAFHTTIPEKAYRYAIPEYLYKQHGIRVYGFHGTSHKYIAEEALKHIQLGGQESKIITIHLGNGCSMAAVKNGASIDTTMGLGPLSGLIMGTRSGDIDPSVIFYLLENGLDTSQVKQILNKDSGMKGLAGDNDLRAINKNAETGDKTAKLALEMYSYRIKKYIGAYIAALGGIDAIVFTAGVGENDAMVRAKSCEGLEHLGISIDLEENSIRKGGIRELQNGKVKVLVVPTNEELEIAQQSFNLLKPA